MHYDLEEIKRDVRIAIDANDVSRNMMDVDTLTTDEIILSKIEEAVNKVHLSAPLYMIEPGNNFAESLHWVSGETGIGEGWTILPDDFLRFMVFKMSDWEVPVYAAILPDNPVYLQQKSRFKGIKGNPQKPVCAIVTRPIGRVLEFYSCRGGEDVTVEMAVYLPVSKIHDGGIDICERCYKSVIYMIAALTASSMNERTDAEIFFNLSNNSLV